MLLACLARGIEAIKKLELTYENMRNVTTTLLVLIGVLLSQPARARLRAPSGLTLERSSVPRAPSFEGFGVDSPLWGWRAERWAYLFEGEVLDVQVVRSRARGWAT